jgi:hypothetical protein
MARNENPRAAAREENKRRFKEDFDSRKEDRRAMTEETLRRMDEAKPTPTQDEVDESVVSIASGLGAIETEEENPVPEEERLVTRESVGGGGAAKYSTRDMTARRGTGEDRKPSSPPGQKAPGSPPTPGQQGSGSKS